MITPDPPVAASDNASDHEVAFLVARAAGGRLMTLRSQPRWAGQPTRSLMDAGDGAAQCVIATLLAQMRPGDALLSEEAVDDRTRLRAERAWIVDPLDGTREYGAGRADFAVHVALWSRRPTGQGAGGIVAAAIDLPAHGRTYTSARPVTVAPLPRTRPLRLLVSRNDRPPGLDRILALASEQLAQAGVNVHGVRTVPLGSVGAKVAELLAGRAEAYLEPRSLHEWDLAAPYACALAAGFQAVQVHPQAFNQPNPRTGPLALVHPELAAALSVALSGTLSGAMPAARQGA